MPYIVYHTKQVRHPGPLGASTVRLSKEVLGLFQDESQARIYAKMVFRKLVLVTPNQDVVVEHIEFKDGCPELTEYILSKK
ncbi:hypothetical protein EBT16_07220 [bacterium]|nr:hypothetical protein [bacterium]